MTSPFNARDLKRMSRSKGEKVKRHLEYNTDYKGLSNMSTKKPTRQDELTSIEFQIKRLNNSTINLTSASNDLETFDAHLKVIRQLKLKALTVGRSNSGRKVVGDIEKLESMVLSSYWYKEAVRWGMSNGNT